MRIAVGGVYKPATLHVGVGGAWKLATLHVGVSGAWKADADDAGGGGSPSMSASASPASRSGTRFGSGTITTATVTVTVTGGTAPVTYLWERVSGSTAISPTAPTSATTAFTGNVLIGDALTAGFVCIVTDHLGQTAPTDTVNVALVETH